MENFLYLIYEFTKDQISTGIFLLQCAMHALDIRVKTLQFQFRSTLIQRLLQIADDISASKCRYRWYILVLGFDITLD